MFKKFIPQKAINLGKHLPVAVSANLKYGFPSKKLKVIGVTGTDGKTTTVNMIYSVLKSGGKKVSMISTISAVVAGKNYDTGFHVTSPDPFMIQKFIKQSVENGDEYLVLEVTSHALDQFRVWGIKFDVGVITNITHEHLDYHKTFENYLQTKAKLVKGVNLAVLNRDDPNFEKLKRLSGNSKVTTFGLNKNADINPDNFSLKLKLVGEYNLYNALAAALVARYYGVEDKVIKNSLENFDNLSGRMEEVKNNRGLKIIIDFAHTPNALESALTALRSQTKDKLISVFGAASKRDETKRPIMGQISAKLADITILTDEDPRFEDSLKIIDQIKYGAISAGAKIGDTLYIEPDRQSAIKLALELASKGDIVGVFGKGHERSMNYKGVEKPWSDQQAVSKALNQLK